MKIQDQVSTVRATHSDELKALSFFSGAMGLDIGLHKVGIYPLIIT